MEQQYQELGRQVVAVKDIMSFWGRKERQSHKILSNVKKALRKASFQPVTISEFSKYYGIDPAELQNHIAKIEAQKPLPVKKTTTKPTVKTLSTEELMNPLRKESTYVFSPKPQ